MASMAFIGILEIVGRFILGSSFVWIYPMNLLLFSWLVFIGMPVVYYQKGYVVIDYFVNFLSVKYQRTVNIIINFILIIFFIFLFIEVFLLMGMQTQELQVLHIPRYIRSLPLFIGSFSVLLVIFYDTLILIRDEGRN